MSPPGGTADTSLGGDLRSSLQICPLSRASHGLRCQAVLWGTDCLGPACPPVATGEHDLGVSKEPERKGGLAASQGLRI